MRAITKAQFARERNFSRTRLYQLIDDGRVQVLEDGRIDADDAHARLDANLDQSKGIRRTGNVTSSGPGNAMQSLLPEPGRSDEAAISSREQTPDESGGEAAGDQKVTSRDDSGYWAHKARREKAEAEMAEMKALQAAGALVSASAIRKEAIATAREFRNALLAIPDRVASVLDPANPQRAHKLLTSEIVKVLRGYGSELERRAVEAAGTEEREAAVL